MRRFGGKDFDLSFLSPPNGVYRCKVIYAEDILSVEFLAYEKKEIKTLKLVESDIAYSHKFVDRKDIENIFALRGEADDILVVKNGLLADTSIANIALLDKNGRWLTPKTPLLCGTMRQKLLNDGFLIEADIKASDICGFEGVAIMNALRKFEPLGRVEKVFALEL
jgi:4-amino-4-deoxychorismate lyase